MMTIDDFERALLNARPGDDVGLVRNGAGDIEFRAGEKTIAVFPTVWTTAGWAHRVRVTS